MNRFDFEFLCQLLKERSGLALSPEKVQIAIGRRSDNDIGCPAEAVADCGGQAVRAEVAGQDHLYPLGVERAQGAEEPARHRVQVSGRPHRLADDVEIGEGWGIFVGHQDPYPAAGGDLGLRFAPHGFQDRVRRPDEKPQLCAWRVVTIQQPRGGQPRFRRRRVLPGQNRAQLCFQRLARHPARPQDHRHEAG